MLGPWGPLYLRGMHKPLKGWLHLYKRPVLRKADNLAGDPAADGVFHVDLSPGVGHLLLEAKRDLLVLLVIVKHYDINILPDLKVL